MISELSALNGALFHVRITENGGLVRLIGW